MCGIIGYVGPRECKPLLLHGLERLEYRGYDSAGIALLEDEGLDYVRAVGNLDQLKAVTGLDGSTSSTGVGHTRWATHGKVSFENAHPLTGCVEDEVAVVLNGIVENFRELKNSLLEDGHAFSSETDAEVVAHLVERYYQGDFADAVAKAYAQLEGHFAFVVGIGDEEMFLASSIAAFLRETRRVQLIEDGEVVAITKDGATFVSVEDGPREREEFEVDWDDEDAEKHGYETFMLKEIYEQPQAVAETIGERVRGETLDFDDIGLTELETQNLRRMVVLATGTAYHAGVIGRYVVEEWARLPCEPDIASEWRYRNPVLTKDTLVVGISQSGETRDTVHALRLARESGARTVAITNMMGTQITQEVERVLYTRAGIEMSVAATKTFTAQVTLLYLLALHLAQARNTLPEEEIRTLLDEVSALPAKIGAYLDGDHPIEEIAQRHYQAPFFLYLGRHIGLPLCLEGALKLKELSYIPTDAYSAGEMKHGPIALLDEQTPVVCIATDSHVYDKVVSNIQEVRARGADVIAIATDGNEDIQHHADDVIYVPRTHPFLQAALAVIPLQLLAYRIARLRGLNIDQPRNLAKTVTVE